MGWTGVNNPYKTVKEYIKNEWFSFSDKEKFELLNVSMVGSTAYMAIKYIPTGEVYAEVVLTHTNNRDYYNLTYKNMSEHCGPYYYDCPAKILKMLTPTENENALEWRAKCREKIESKKKKPKVEAGVIIKFSNPITFTNGYVSDTFIVKKNGRATYFSPVNGYGYYQIRKWQHKEFEIVG